MPYYTHGVASIFPLGRVVMPPELSEKRTTGCGGASHVVCRAGSVLMLKLKLRLVGLMVTVARDMVVKGPDNGAGR